MSGIQIANLVYDISQKRVLNDINLDVRAGEIVSVMGQSGSGKTTLLKLMTGLLRPTSGRILIDDVDIARLNENELDEVRLKMGLVFQYAALLDSLTIYENIIFAVVRHRKRVPRQELDQLVADLLAQVELHDVQDKYPSELSGGMQKRVGLARALAMHPPIVFYDEPTSGLDPITSNTIDELIMETRRRHNVTQVVVSHHLPSIFRISDRIAMLHQGEIIIYGTPDEVRSCKEPIVQAFINPEINAARPVS
jgi:phospholipid/cholesterol/gamma-HCH transport system ATP-binding protein